MNYSILFIVCILVFFFLKNEHFVNYNYKPKDKVCLTTRKPYINNVFNSSNYINPEIHDSKSNYYIRINFHNMSSSTFKQLGGCYESLGLFGDGAEVIVHYCIKINTCLIIMFACYTNNNASSAIINKQ